MDTIKEQISKIEELLGENMELWGAALRKLGFRPKETLKGFEIQCLMCGQESIKIRIKNRRGHAKWQCGNKDCFCRKDGPKKDMAGLIKMYHPELSNYFCIVLYKDATFVPKGEAPKVILEFGKHKGKLLSEAPYTYLLWYINRPDNDPELSALIKDYIFGPKTPQELKTA